MTKQYAKVIKKYRKKRNLTQSELAKKIHSSQQAVARWELEKTEPNLDSLSELSKALNIPISHFIDEDITSSEETFLALYRSLDATEQQQTIEFMELLKRHKQEKEALLKRFIEE
ncbi:helix-turn-helix transcriptional regulator [Enterococcus rotai]|uniref:helix-turn-helix transcriptional regulator n=1 Tax=Enterococcus rotai TaxID=118060 RepID=UPI0035C73561